MNLILLLMGLIIFTDFADGYLARWLEDHGYPGSVSAFGEALDRFRDKFFQFIMFAFFLLDPRISPWLKGVTCPLIIVELLLLATLFMGVKKKVRVKAGIWGKAKMFLMSVGILGCPIIIIIQENGVEVPFSAIQTVFWILMISLGLAIMSFIKHIKQYREQLQPQSQLV